MVTIAALGLLLAVLVVAAVLPFRVAILAALLADLSLNYFFMPPFHTFTIADPQNWAALFVFLAVSAIASSLSSAARDRAREALARRDELARLFDLSRDVLLTTDTENAMTRLAEVIARRFELDLAAICLPRGAEWEVAKAGPDVAIDHAVLSEAFMGASSRIEFDASLRAYTGHVSVQLGDREARIVPLRVGTRPVGLLVAAGRPIEAGTLDALAGVAAIAVERAHLLAAQKAAELSRQSEALKSALLASLAHDLRTPLTAITVAANNVTAPWLDEAGRHEQRDLILVEAERLDRLFQNILDMARIDAHAVSAERRWVHPAEILEAARGQVEHNLAGRTVAVAVDGESVVFLDPRLTASALARLLENAAQYAPAGTPIEVRASTRSDGLVISVRDHGPGIAEADLPHLFDRFFRGAAAGRRSTGTGMGLAIARGILAAEDGRVWAENCADGGARFTVSVPADVRPSTAAEEEP